MTLIELMVVVVIIGILATLAVYGISKYIAASKTAEVGNIIGSIKAGEEAYFDETFRYLTVTNGLDEANAHPPAVDADTKAMWGAGDDDVVKRFQTLGVMPLSPVGFKYVVVADDTNVNDIASIGVVPAAYGNLPAERGYIVMAYGYPDRGADPEVFISSNFNAEIFHQ